MEWFMSNLEGMVLSDYLLLQCIGMGGVADVYRAYQQGASNSEAAVKVFRSSYAERVSFRDYFMLEAEKIGQFNHANILPIHEYGEGEQLLYLVTPFVTTGTLDDLLTRVGGRLSASQALPIMQQLCSAVQYAHEHNVIHGNIKPGNIFVAADGRMLLTDFGIARGYDDSQQSLTRVGWGSAEYASPEQSLGILHPSSDIYVLGVLLFRLLTGIPPFSGQTPIEVLLKHVRQAPPSVCELVNTISESVENVLRIALQKRADDRFATAADLSNAFLAAVTVAPIASPVSRHFGVPAPLFASRVTTTHPIINDPLTPLPPFIALAPLLNAVPVSEVPVLTEEASPLQKPVLFPAEDMSGSDVTEIRRKNFLQENDDKDLGQFWLADPQEWSPLANPMSQDGFNDKLPLTAGEYLQNKPVIAENPPASSPVADAPRKEEKKPGGIVHKWLPIIVVILLILGLLGALLSSMLFPSEKPSLLPNHIGIHYIHVIA
jgi:serine/threonine protein kinase